MDIPLRHALRPRGTRARSGTDQVETELAFWIEHLEKIDETLKDPALSLIEIAGHFLKGAGCGTYIDDRGSVLRMLPISIGETRPSAHPSVLVHALCCSTLQRLSRLSRRFAWLDSEAAKTLRRLEGDIPKTILREHLEQSTPDFMFVLADDIFGTLNPFTSAEVFRVFINAGEEWAHRGVGFLAGFGMLWALAAATEGKSRPDRPLAPSVVARCLVPLKQLETTIVTRSSLYRKIGKLCVALESNSTSTNPYRRWKYACGLDELAGFLDELAKVAINGPTITTAADGITSISAEIRPRDFSARWDEVLNHVRPAVVDIGTCNRAVLAEASTVLEMLERVKLTDPAVRQQWKIELRPRIRNEESDQYWQDMDRAAKEALATCRQIVQRLRSAAETAETIPSDARAKVLRTSLDKLADFNDEVADLIRCAVAPTLSWCRQVVRQEVAYASAGNDTEFDAADLLSAIAVVERWEQISDLEVADALRKAMRGAREDGSWSTGQPMYVRNRLLGVWPGTSDMAWLLSMAATGKKSLRIADEALMRFADWLGRTTTRIEFRYELHDDVARAASSAPAQPAIPQLVRLPLAGWSPEMRETRSIDLWTTAGAINALLDTRELIEHRLWELCRQRFFVVQNVKTLDKVDPVDLGARHGRRLHHLLRKTARMSRGPDWKRAEYSFVLHGPPGSSKTAIAEALGREMARSDKPRVIRVTPADFTRQGEDRVDSEARVIFDLLTHVRDVMIIFDEIDDLLRRRALKGDPLFLKMIIPAMLNRLQDLRDASPRQEICFVVAMNYVDNTEPALVRPGRIDRAIPVVYPDPWSRGLTLERVIEDENAATRIEPRLRARIVRETAAWPWTTFHRLCRDVAGSGEPVMDDLLDRKIDQYATEFQDAAPSYVFEDRWFPLCPPLVDEVAQFVLTYSRNEGRCNAAVEEKVFGKPKDEKDAWKVVVIAEVRKRLAAIWRTVHERTDYSKRGAMSSESIGATVAEDRKTVAFRVWAPDVTAVAVEIEGREKPIELAEEKNGLWSCDFNQAHASQKVAYRYLIGTADQSRLQPRNDPYAREIEDGANGSFTIARPAGELHGADNDVPGWHDLVIYQIDPQTFGEETPRTWDGITDERLRQIFDLGINAIDLIMPAEYPIEASTTYRPDEVRKLEKRLGGMKALRKLIRRAHNHDLSVIVGVTTRHVLGRGIVDLKQFTGTNDDPYFSDPVTRFGPRPAFDRKEVRDLICENARRWIAEIGADGIRWEGVHFVRNQAGSSDEEMVLRPGIAVMQAVNQLLMNIPYASDREKIRRTITIAQDARELSSTVGRGPHDGHFGTQWNPSFAQSLRRAIHDPNNGLKDLATAIAFRYTKDAFTRVIYAESRDTIGERLAASVRSHATRSRSATATVDEVERKSILAAAVVLSAPGIPMLMQGQEFACETHPVDWTLRESRRHVLEAFRQLIQLRRDWWNFSHGLRGHGAWVSRDNGRPVLTVHRWHQGRTVSAGRIVTDDVVVVLNFGVDRLEIEVAVPHEGEWLIRFNSDSAFGTTHDSPVIAERVDHQHRVRLDIGPYGVLILSQSQ